MNLRGVPYLLQKREMYYEEYWLRDKKWSSANRNIGKWTCNLDRRRWFGSLGEERMKLWKVSMVCGKDNNFIG